MNISQNGIDLIKRYEGLRLKAYKPVATEKYWTIGYGHYGADVKSDMVITEAEAEHYLIKDLDKSIKAVDKYDKIYHFNQNQFDALVSFTFNCGSGNLKKLLDDGKRSTAIISNKILEYNKGGGVVLKGLVKRRAEEQTLFNTYCGGSEYYNKYTGCSMALDTIFSSIGVPSKYCGRPENRKPVAEANGIIDYKGTYGQNMSLIKLCKLGTLRKVKEV